MYYTIDKDDNAVKTMVNILRCDRRTTFEGMFESPFEPLEIHLAIRTGGRRKAPGNNWIGREFHVHNWYVIRDDRCDTMKQIFWAAHITLTKSEVCSSVPKKTTIENPMTIAQLFSSVRITRYLLTWSSKICPLCRLSFYNNPLLWNTWYHYNRRSGNGAGHHRISLKPHDPS